MFKVNNNDISHQYQYLDDVNDVVKGSLLLTLNILHTFSWVSNVDFEKVKVCWVAYYKKPPPPPEGANNSLKCVADLEC